MPRKLLELCACIARLLQLATLLQDFFQLASLERRLKGYAITHLLMAWRNGSRGHLRSDAILCTFMGLN